MKKVWVLNSESSFGLFLERHLMIQKVELLMLPNQDIPGGTVDRNLPANAGDTGVRSLVEEDPTWHRATKRMGHNY